MTLRQHTGLNFCRQAASRTNALTNLFRFSVFRAILPSMVLLLGGTAVAQVNVLTAHNDIGRSGQNLNETVLTPGNVNVTNFGKLFSQQVSGSIWAQPLYVSQVAIPGLGTHNIVYVATSTDMVYAFDADSNGGASAKPLWQVSLLTNTTPAGTLTANFGVKGTPVIDLASKTMYLASSEMEGSTAIARMHALDITTGAEKLGGPVSIKASIPGTGNASVGGTLAFDPSSHLQRPGLLLLNGVVYVAFGSVNDEGPWHGWIFSYKETTLQQLNAFCTTANGAGGGLWMGGAALAAEVNDAAKPYGRMFIATGNGTSTGAPPYTAKMSYSMSVLDLDLTGGVMTVEDEFTPYNWANLNSQDADIGSGGPLLLPTQTMASGKVLSPLVQIAKSGMIYILDRNKLGGFNAGADQVVQEVQTPITSGFNWGAGVWGTEAYWNNRIYSGGTNVPNGSTYIGSGNSLAAYSFVNGVVSTTPTSQSVEKFVYPGPTPSISASGPAENGILWVLMTDAYTVQGADVLLAYDAGNLATTLYSTNDNLTRDNPGPAVKFTVPTVANGKVYVGTNGQLSFYGLLADTSKAPTPTISPNSGSYTGTEKVTITDAVAGATIYYTLDGSTPTPQSAVYTSPLAIASNVTVTAVASPNGYLQSEPASATYISTSTTANPKFSLVGGIYAGARTLTLSDSSTGAKIHYTQNGSTPTVNSPLYTQPLAVAVPETIQAIAIAPGLYASAVVSASYTIQPVYTIDYSQGFSVAQGPMTFNGSTDLDDFRLQLTNGGVFEKGSAFYATPVSIQAFTTDFTFQLSNPVGDGVTFTIQDSGPTALGSYGSGLGYAGIPKSVAIKFDLYNNAGEGPDSTGIYLNGAVPTMPAVDLTGTAINLHSGDYVAAHITYDGTNLVMTLTDEVTLENWSHIFTINLPEVLGSNTAYVGFTGGTGTDSASQKLTYWTYSAGPLLTPNYPAGFDSAGITMNNGTALNGARLRLTDTKGGEARSAFFTLPVNVQQFHTSFDFQLTDAVDEGFTFTIQNAGPTAVGKGNGNLGYSPLATSVAVKFDLNSNEGEGPDSTGLYDNGASPTVPYINLSDTGINLHSGDLFNAQLSYNGTTLTVVITDSVTHAVATQTYSTNIPSIVGGPTAYVGFTGGTGTSGAIQEIVNWSYSAGASN